MCGQCGGFYCSCFFFLEYIFHSQQAWGDYMPNAIDYDRLGSVIMIIIASCFFRGGFLLLLAFFL